MPRRLAVSPSPTTRVDRVLALQRRAGNAAVVRAVQQRRLQRDIDIERSLQQTHGLLLEKIGTAPNASKLFKLCEGSRNTHLLFRGYYGRRGDFGETRCHVRGREGELYDLDDPGRVNWDVVDRESEISITILMNIGHVFGRAKMPRRSCTRSTYTRSTTCRSSIRCARFPTSVRSEPSGRERSAGRVAGAGSTAGSPPAGSVD